MNCYNQVHAIHRYNGDRSWRGKLGSRGRGKVTTSTCARDDNTLGQVLMNLLGGIQRIAQKLLFYSFRE